MKRNEFSYTRMPFGQYRGRYLREVPDQYLAWASMAVSDQGLALMFRAELANRHTDWQQLEAKLQANSRNKHKQHQR